jgi:ferredoxin
MITDLIMKGKPVVKIICGAGNEDMSSIEILTSTYIKAGVRYFDVSANIEIVRLIKRLYKEHGIKGYICVSYGIAGDPHIQKLEVNKNCNGCGDCIEYCDQRALGMGLNLTIDEDRCIGCGRCIPPCKVDALSLVDKPKSIKSTLPDIVKEGIDTVELHVASGNTEAYSKWKEIESIYDGTLSLCLDRGKHSDSMLKEVITQFTKDRAPFTTIIQADGLPMSGIAESPAITLQALAIAQIVNRMHLPIYLFLSGGTNDKTAALAKLFNLEYDGISLGSFARKLVNNANNPVDTAKALVMSVEDSFDLFFREKPV